MKLQWKNAGTILGYIGGCFAILTGAIETWSFLVKRPKLVVHPDQQINVGYQPNSHLLRYSAVVSLYNAGTKEENINVVQARLSTQSPRSYRPEDFPFTQDQILLKDESQFACVPPSTSKTLRYEITATLSALPSDHIYQLLTQDQVNISRELVLTFFGDKKSYKASYRFGFGPDMKVDVFDDGKTRTIRASSQ